MKHAALLIALLTLSACAATEAYQGPTATQDRLVQPGPARDHAYWDALDNVPGARTGEADYYYSHRGGAL